MDKKALTALQGSIKKWEAILNEGGIDLQYENCPLCKEFNENEDGPLEDGCNGCPVSAKVNMSGCIRTPYEAWSEYQVESGQWKKGRKVFDEKSKQMAQDELNFLRSLLP